MVIFRPSKVHRSDLFAISINRFIAWELRLAFTRARRVTVWRPAYFTSAYRKCPVYLTWFRRGALTGEFSQSKAAHWWLIGLESGNWQLLASGTRVLPRSVFDAFSRLIFSKIEKIPKIAVLPKSLLRRFFSLILFTLENSKPFIVLAFVEHTCLEFRKNAAAVAAFFFEKSVKKNFAKADKICTFASSIKPRYVITAFLQVLCLKKSDTGFISNKISVP